MSTCAQGDRPAEVCCNTACDSEKSKHPKGPPMGKQNNELRCSHSIEYYVNELQHCRSTLINTENLKLNEKSKMQYNKNNIV